MRTWKVLERDPGSRVGSKKYSRKNEPETREWAGQIIYGKRR